jgi:RNA polymerase sigma-70 factor (ECF subfamily)
MHTTSPSLLMQLRQPNSAAAWDRFVKLYTPLLVHVLGKRMQVPAQDVSDLVQDIFVTLFRTLPEFEYDRDKGRFRDYLRQVCRSKCADHKRRRSVPVAAGPTTSSLEDVGAEDEFERIWQEDHNRFLVRQALAIMQAEFQPRTWKACWEFVVNDRPAAEVARELGLTENAVFIAKCRVIGRLKRELDGLMDDLT